MTEIRSERVSKEDELRRRLKELAAVSRMAERAVLSEDLDAVLEEAVDTLVEAIGVDRASVLLRDDEGVMRFRASRGLSQAYRAAVEGRSPWTGEEEEFQPIAVPDVLSDPSLDDELRRTVAGEGIRALAFVPLVHRRELLGNFMLYQDAPFDFSEGELQLAQTIASTIAGAVERARAEEALRESNRRLDVVFRRVADGITLQAPTGELVYANEAAARMAGVSSVEELLAAPLPALLERFDLVDENGSPLPLEQLPGRLALRGIDVGAQLVGWRPHAGGEERWSVVSATPVHGEDGRLEFVINVFRDVTAQRRQEQRLAMLARAGEVLAESLEVERTLAEVARLAVPAVGDWCMVYVREEDEIRRIAVEHFAGRQGDVMARLEGHAFRPDAEIGVPAVIRSGEGELYEDADSALVARDVVDGERLAAELDDLGIRSWLCVPLTARGRTFGAMSFLATESGRRFGPEDLEIAQELARRAAVALDNARLYQESERSFALLDAILASAPTAIGLWDRDLRYVRVNHALAELNGLPPEEHVGKTMSEVIPDLAPVLDPVYRRVVESGEPLVRYEASTDLGAHRLGSERHWLSSYFPVKTPDGEVLGLGAVIMEITERKIAEETAAARARQQADVAALGQLALAGAELDELMRVATKRVAATLDVGFVELLKRLPDGGLVLREGVGWREGLVGTTPVPGGRGSQGGFTLDAAGPVVVEDLSAETRFTASPLLRDHEVTSGLTVVISGRDRPVGVLGAHSADRRAFAQDDVNYVQAVANVLAAAVDQRRLAEAESLARERLSFLADASRLLATSLDYEETIQAVADLAGTHIADWMTVSLLEGGEIKRIVGRHPGAEEDALVQEILERYPPSPLDEGNPLQRVLVDGESLLLEEIPDELLRRVAQDDRQLELLRRLGLRSSISVPIRAGGEILGAVSFIRSRPPAYTHEDVALAEEFARRAGLAIENARLYQAAQYQVQLNRAITENAASALFLADGAGRGTYMNAAAEAMTGFTVDEMRGQSLHELMHHTRPDGTPFPAEECPILAVVARRREPLREFEDTFVRKDGSFFPVVYSVTPILESGRLAGLVLEARDVTGEREAQRALEYQSRLTRTITEYAASALFFMDEHGQPTYMNPAAAEMTGFTLEEIEGAPLHEAVHHSRPDGTGYPIEECPIDRPGPKREPVGPYEDVFVRKDGTFFPVLAAAVPIVSDGRLAGTVLEVRDITREKELLEREQDARREAEARAQSAQALEFVGDGVFLVDPQGIVRLWNPAAEAITGLLGVDVVGRPAEAAIPGWPALAPRVPVVSAERGTAARPQTLPLEIDARELWLSISGVGFDAGTVFAFRDVTEERGLEKLKSDFVSTISHELRTPLAAIYGAALTLRRDDMPLQDYQRTDLLSVIASESERLARIVNDILWTSRIESGGLQVTIEACDGAALALGVVQAARLQLHERLELVLEVPESLPDVAADPDKVRQVLTNLVENAVKYSPDGGRVVVRLEASGDRVRFLVSDQGLGIPARERERIFEKFYRLDPHLTRGVGGTGLGLYICRELVHRMDGRIWVESEEGTGSTFVVELPAAGEVLLHSLSS